MLRSTFWRGVVSSGRCIRREHVLGRRLASSANALNRVVTVERELPDPFAGKKQNRAYFVTYGVAITLVCIFIFNYEKTRSPLTNSVMYYIRRSSNASSFLGENINFRDSWPWILGQLNTASGDIDISFAVRGSKNTATLYLKASRESKSHPFKIHHFYLEPHSPDSGRIDLLNDPSIDFAL